MAIPLEANRMSFRDIDETSLGSDSSILVLIVMLMCFFLAFLLSSLALLIKTLLNCMSQIVQEIGW